MPSIDKLIEMLEQIKGDKSILEKLGLNDEYNEDMPMDEEEGMLPFGEDEAIPMEGEEESEFPPLPKKKPSPKKAKKLPKEEDEAEPFIDEDM